MELYPKTIPMNSQVYDDVLRASAILESAATIANIVGNASVKENEWSCVMYGISTMLEVANDLLGESLSSKRETT